MLKRKRLEAGLTQEEPAKRIGRRQPYIHDVEAGQCQLKVPQMDEIADVLGTTTYALIGSSTRSRRRMRKGRARNHAESEVARLNNAPWRSRLACPRSEGGH